MPVRGGARQAAVPRRHARCPVPRLLAIHHATRRMPGVPCIGTADPMMAFLRRPDAYPLFGKPTDGMYSLRAFSADAWLADNDSVAFHDGTRQKVAGFAARLAERTARHLLQERLEPHPELVPVFDPRLSSVRLLVLLTPAGPLIARAVCKMATGSNLADNFWRAGNMLGAVDTVSGEIRRVVRGVGADMVVNPNHPDTGATILGMRLPLWDRIKELCQSAALTLPGVRTQSRDIAMTRDGPVLLEVNYGEDLSLFAARLGCRRPERHLPRASRACGYNRENVVAGPLRCHCKERSDEAIPRAKSSKQGISTADARRFTQMHHAASKSVGNAPNLEAGLAEVAQQAAGSPVAFG